MKTTVNKTKVPLHLESNDTFVLYGIVSTEPDYKLCLQLNKELQIALKHYLPLEITDEKGNEASFSKFADHSGAPDSIFSFISNKSGNSFLLKKLKSYDYFFLVHESDNGFNASLFTRKLKESRIFSAIFPLDPQNINDKYFKYLIP